MKASNKPTASPNTMPSANEWTLRAKNPTRTPAMMPLIVEQITIPASCTRASGVNQAVMPSMSPRIAPSTRPRRILFISNSPPLLWYYPFFQVPLTAGQQNKQNADEQIDGNQHYGRPMSGVHPAGTLEKDFRIGHQGVAIRVCCVVGGRIWWSLIAVGRRERH